MLGFDPVVNLIQSTTVKSITVIGSCEWIHFQPVHISHDSPMSSENKSVNKNEAMGANV